MLTVENLLSTVTDVVEWNIVLTDEDWSFFKLDLWYKNWYMPLAFVCVSIVQLHKFYDDHVSLQVNKILLKYVG